MKTTKINELFAGIPDKSGLDTMMAFVELPDEQFDELWPQFRQNFMSILSSEKFQKEQKDALDMIPGVTAETLQEEKDYYKNIIYDISQEPDLSENKKEFFTLLFTAIADVHEQLILSGRTQVEVKITKLNPDAIIPQYAHPTDAGADVCAVEETKIEAGETKVVKTGIAIAIPAGYEIQVRPRSGLSLKSGLRIANAPGTIDADYRGEVGIIMTNTKDIPYVIDKGMKIAQLVIAPTPMIKWNEVATVEELGTTERGEGSFGSTGAKAQA